MDRRDCIKTHVSLPGRRSWQVTWRLEHALPAAGLRIRRLARVWMNQAVEQVRQMQVGALGIVMPDGGIPVDGFVRMLAPNHCEEVARQFLLSD